MISLSFNGPTLSIGFHETDPTRLYWVDPQFVYTSRDFGASIVSIYTNQQPSGGWQSRGVDNIVTWDFQFDASGDVLYLGMPDVGCWRSLDDGASWLNCNVQV